jgi:hypothetical protein
MALSAMTVLCVACRAPASVVGTWKASLSSGSSASDRIQPLILTLRDDGSFLLDPLMYEGKWSEESGRLKLLPSRKTPPLEILDQGFVQPGLDPAPLYISINGSHDTLTWIPTRGGQATTRPYIFQRSSE